ncbi:uncharacterized protein LOC101850416 [Aplysia californica]|uniref:Uncharacterized protein LOC101850416 n=1 Tax=Aplysia californica TaxID=6500 RepID=A0ABM0JPJ8_APLCA|nr:uncharacterized protein LOC101850416 [Aplysia californica]
MARNEEKQLARLNRVYLQQQKDEALKKRPPRPSLNTLNTADEVKKWLPSILSDIDFYVKQMKVTCYPERQVDEFSKRIDGLKGEYKAFLRKIRQLDPDVQATPWSDRPYSKKKRLEQQTYSCELTDTSATCSTEADPQAKFQPLSAPILSNDSFYDSCYGYRKDKTEVENDLINTSSDLQDEPLQFNFSSVDRVIIPTSGSGGRACRLLEKYRQKKSQNSVPAICASGNELEASNSFQVTPSEALPNWRLMRDQTKPTSTVGCDNTNNENMPHNQQSWSADTCDDALVFNGSASNTKAAQNKKLLSSSQRLDSLNVGQDISSPPVGVTLYDDKKGSLEPGTSQTSVPCSSSQITGSLGLPYTDSSSSDEGS